MVAGSTLLAAARLDDGQNPAGTASVGGRDFDDSVHDPAVYRFDGLDSVYAKGRIFAEWSPGAPRWSDSFFSFGGMVLIMSLHLFPFLYLSPRDALIRIGGNLEEAGAVHGASAGYRFRRIILPPLSSYGMGAMLVFVKTIAEFGTPATFGRRIGYYVMTSEIHKYISSWPIDFGKATSLASVLLSVCLVMWYMQSTISRRFTYRLVGGKGQRSKRYWRAAKVPSALFTSVCR